MSSQVRATQACDPKANGAPVEGATAGASSSGYPSNRCPGASKRAPRPQAAATPALPDAPRSGSRRLGAGRGGGGKLLLQFTQENNSGERAARLLELNRLLESSLRAVGRDTLADQVSGCHRAFIGWACRTSGEKHRWAVPERSCQVRLCAFEMRARAARSLRRFEKPLAELQDPRYLVLSERNVPLGGLAEGIETLFDSFQRLRETTLWRFVRGCVLVLELTYNQRARSWHPHLNVIFDGPFLVHRQLVKAWKHATRGRGEIVWIERLCCRRGISSRGKIHAENCGSPEARLDAAREVFKYVTKLADLAEVPEAVDEFLRATHGAKFLRSYGTMYRLPKEEKFALTCPDCGSADVRRLGFVPLSAVALDGQGVLRFDDSFLVEAAESPPINAPPVELTTWPKPIFPLSQINAA